jgi:hypothetical protein
VIGGVGLLQRHAVGLGGHHRDTVVCGDYQPIRLRRIRNTDLGSRELAADEVHGGPLGQRVTRLVDRHREDGALTDRGEVAVLLLVGRRVEDDQGRGQSREARAGVAVPSDLRQRGGEFGQP